MLLQEVGEFLEAYRSFSVDMNRRKVDSFDQLLTDFEPLHERITAKRRQTAGRFNIFEALGVERSELIHSAFIAHLLDPYAQHDQGARFLGTFLERLSVAVPSGADLERSRVASEFPLNEHGRLDIAVFLSDGTIIGIENKVDAGEQEQQVARYQQWLARHERLSIRRHLLIFLTPDGRPPTTAVSDIDLVLCSYGELTEWLRSLGTLPPRLATVVSMYADVCSCIGRRL